MVDGHTATLSRTPCSKSSHLQLKGTVEELKLKVPFLHGGQRGCGVSVVNLETVASQLGSS